MTDERRCERCGGSEFQADGRCAPCRRTTRAALKEQRREERETAKSPSGLKQRALALVEEEISRLEADQKSTPASGVVKSSELQRLLKMAESLQPEEQDAPQRVHEDLSRLSVDEVRVLHNLTRKARGLPVMFHVPRAVAKAIAFPAAVDVSAVPSAKPTYQGDPLVDDEARDAIAAYENGEKVSALAARFRCSAAQVIHTLRSAGMSI